MELLYDTVIELDIYLKTTETYLHKNLYNNFIHNSQKLEITQMCFNRKVKPTVLYFKVYYSAIQ